MKTAENCLRFIGKEGGINTVCKKRRIFRAGKLL
jgi:hypothetical protein